TPERRSLTGRIGRGANPPPQLGQTLNSTSSTHSAQNVHSYEQIRASTALGGKSLSQYSQLGLSSSINLSLYTACAASRCAAASTASRRCRTFASFCWRRRARIAGGAVSGEPDSKGGAGAYSICSWIAWATSGPAISATRLSAKS